MICDLCGCKDDVVACPQCETPVCWDCRPDETCPICGANTEANAKCSVAGGCGTGGQEDPT